MVGMALIQGRSSTESSHRTRQMRFLTAQMSPIVIISLLLFSLSFGFSFEKIYTASMSNFGDTANTAGAPQEYTQDGPEARRIASVIPYYPFHGQ